VRCSEWTDREVRRTYYEAAGYAIEAAEPDAWRNFDPSDPAPGYFEFDWLSARPRTCTTGSLYKRRG
jgi:hypothetical protein